MSHSRAREIRLGNLIYLNCTLPSPNEKGEFFELRVYAANSTVIRDAEHYGKNWAGEPIPLTEEWLVKMRFTKDCITPYREDWKLGTFSLAKNRDGYYFQWGIAIQQRVNLKYVHQLQNIFFDLTEKEIVIDL